MTTGMFLSFLFFTFVTAFTPGPNVILTFSTAKTYGFRKTCPLMAGISSGFSCIMVISAILTLTLNSLSENFTAIMKYIGAAYIFWLAWKVVSSKAMGDGESQKIPSYFTGFCLQFVNIKVILYGLISLSTFVIPYDRRFSTVFLSVLFLVAMGIASLLAWSTLGSAFRRILKKHDRIINIILALLLVESAVSLLLN